LIYKGVFINIAMCESPCRHAIVVVDGVIHKSLFGGATDHVHSFSKPIRIHSFEITISTSMIVIFKCCHVVLRVIVAGSEHLLPTDPKQWSSDDGKKSAKALEGVAPPIPEGWTISKPWTILATEDPGAYTRIPRVVSPVLFL
jgi:hypothetical protein